MVDGAKYAPPVYEGGWQRIVSCGEDEAKREYDTSIDVFTTVCTFYSVVLSSLYRRILKNETRFDLNFKHILISARLHV